MRMYCQMLDCTIPTGYCCHACIVGSTFWDGQRYCWIIHTNFWCEFILDQDFKLMRFAWDFGKGVWFILIFFICKPIFIFKWLLSSQHLDADAMCAWGLHPGAQYIKWHSSPPVSHSLKGKMMGCGSQWEDIVHDEPTKQMMVWCSG